MPDASLIDRYRDSLLRHLPKGSAITRVLGSEIALLFVGLAPEFARVHERALDLVREAFPPESVELLPMWEDVFDLPSDCYVPTTLEGRQKAVLARLVGIGGHGSADYEALAAALGYSDIEWGHYPPFTVDSSVDDLIYDDTWAHAVRVSIVMGDYDELLECEFNRQRRTHSVLHFEFVSADADVLFVNGEPLLVDGGEPLLIGV